MCELLHYIHFELRWSIFEDRAKFDDFIKINFEQYRRHIENSSAKSLIENNVVIKNYVYRHRHFRHHNPNYSHGTHVWYLIVHFMQLLHFQSFIA